MNLKNDPVKYKEWKEARSRGEFRNTGKPVTSKNVKNKESISNNIGWKFNYNKYGKTNIS